MLTDARLKDSQQISRATKFLCATKLRTQTPRTKTMCFKIAFVTFRRRGRKPFHQHQCIGTHDSYCSVPATRDQQTPAHAKSFQKGNALQQAEVKGAAQSRSLRFRQKKPAKNEICKSHMLDTVPLRTYEARRVPPNLLMLYAQTPDAIRSDINLSACARPSSTTDCTNKIRRSVQN